MEKEEKRRNAVKDTKKRSMRKMAGCRAPVAVQYGRSVFIRLLRNGCDGSDVVAGTRQRSKFSKYRFESYRELIRSTEPD